MHLKLTVSATEPSDKRSVTSHSGPRLVRLVQPVRVVREVWEVRLVREVAGPQPVVTGSRLVTAELSVLHPSLHTHMGQGQGRVRWMMVACEGTGLEG